MLRVRAPTVLILAAGEGTRMRSDVPKVLHRICGRPMIEWPIAAAREAGAGRVVVVDGPDAQARRRAARGRRAGDPGASRTAPATLSAPPPTRSARTTRCSSSTATFRSSPPRRSPRSRRRTRRTAPRPRWRRWSSKTRAATAASIRASDGSVERVVETKRPGDATPEEEAIREVNTGIYAFDGRDLVATLESAQLRQRPGRALPARRAPAPARGRQGDRRARRHRRHADARRQHARRARHRPPARPAAHPRGPRAQRRHDRRPRLAR